MQQTFLVEAIADPTQELVEVTIRCSPGLINIALDVAKVQIENLQGANRSQVPQPMLEPGPEPRLGLDIWAAPTAPVINRPGPILPRV